MKEKVVQIDSVNSLARNSPDLYLEQNQFKAAERRATPRTVVTQTIDTNGEIIAEHMRNYRHQNGSGFVISYTEKMCEFLEKVTTGSIVRVFVYLAHRQNYGNDGKMFGYRCSHKYLQKVLNMTKPTLWDALKYLKDNYLVHVGKVDGQFEFMVNPLYVTIGSDRKTRMTEWNRRWAKTFKEAKRK